jgi:putative SOS response-associated peptidase YedK
MTAKNRMIFGPKDDGQAALWGVFPDWVKMKNPAAPTRSVRLRKIGAAAEGRNKAPPQ